MFAQNGANCRIRSEFMNILVIFAILGILQAIFPEYARTGIGGILFAIIFAILFFNSLN